MSTIFGWLLQNQFASGGLTLMVIGGALAIARKVPGEIWAFLVRRTSITVEVPDRDPAFAWLQAWVAEQSYARRARDLSLKTIWEADADDPEVDGYSETGKASEARFLLSPAPGRHVMLYRGRLLILWRHRRDLQNGGSMAFQETLTLKLIAGDRGRVDSLLREAHRAALPKVPGVAILTAKYDDWYATSWRPRRPLASICLAEGLLESLLDDLRGFLGSGPWYAARGVPHRRGYLLHGPPGNGKTTLVTAVAGELGLSVAVLSLSNRALNDDGLRALVDALPRGTILLMEDIDCAFAQRKAEEASVGVTLSGLLNALDGVSSREGRILFMTTNHPDRLDPALVRPGRVDRGIRLGLATADQARRLFAWFYAGGPGESDSRIDALSRAFASRVSDGRVSMASIQEHLLRHRADPEVAALAEDLAPADEPAEPVADLVAGPA